MDGPDQQTKLNINKTGPGKKAMYQSAEDPEWREKLKVGAPTGRINPLTGGIEWFKGGEKEGKKVLQDIINENARPKESPPLNPEPRKSRPPRPVVFEKKPPSPKESPHKGITDISKGVEEKIITPKLHLLRRQVAALSDPDPEEVQAYLRGLREREGE